MKNKLLILIIMFSICFQGCTSKKVDHKIYLEDTSIFTTSNDGNSSFYYRFYTHDKSDSYTTSAKTSNPDITADVSLSDHEDNAHQMEINLHTPPGEYIFDIIVTVNDKKFTIKDVHHINFNHPNAPDILDEHHVKSEYPSPKSFPTDYTYKVNFTQPIEAYDFKVYGEELKSLEKVSNKCIQLKTRVEKPSISSLTYVVNGEEYSLYDIYHVVSDDYYKKKFLK